MSVQHHFGTCTVLLFNNEGQTPHNSCTVHMYVCLSVCLCVYVLFQRVFGS